MIKLFNILFLAGLVVVNLHGQKLVLGEQEFELKNVTGSIIDFQGEKVLKIERDLNAIPFDEDRLEATVDEPTFALLTNLDFKNGTIEVKMYSQLQDPMPQNYKHAQGFIGVAFRVSENEEIYESIYLRPKVGRSDNQRHRNHTVQYYAYPDYKFETLRNLYPGKYETSAPVNINEWITMRIEVNGKKAEMFINDSRYSTFVVDSMLSKSIQGGIGLYVDMGTVGYFKDLKVTSLQSRIKEIDKDKDSSKNNTSLKRVFQPQGEVNEVPYGANDHAGQYVQTADAKIYYESYGEGQPFVILHGGIFGSTIEMVDFIDNLKENFQVIAISTRGHGKSEIGAGPITYEKKANDVASVINAVTKDSVILLGFSDGAYTGYKVASMYPGKVKKLIAIGAGEQVPGLRQVVFPDTTQAFNMDSAYWNQQLELMPEPDRLQEFWDKMEVFYNTMTASKQLFSSLQCPVLLISGELDRNAPLPTIINAYNMIPNSQLAIIPNAGHVVFHENFEGVWASIKPFLNNQFK